VEARHHIAIVTAVIIIIIIIVVVVVSVVMIVIGFRAILPPYFCAYVQQNPELGIQKKLKIYLI